MTVWHLFKHENFHNRKISKIHSLYILVYKCTCIIKTFIFLYFTGQVQWLTKALSLFQYLSFYKLDNIIGDGDRLIHTGSCCSGRFQWLNRARNPRSIFRYLCSWNIVLLQQQWIYQWPYSFCLHIFTVKYEILILHVDVHFNFVFPPPDLSLT